MAPYVITVRFYQTNTKAFFNLVEKTVYGHYVDGFWSEVAGQHVLTMDESGTSGALRFKSPETNEEVVFVFGVHNYKHWCDAVPDAPKKKNTALVVNGDYYNGGFRSSQREKQLPEFSRQGPTGKTFTVKYTVAEGNDLRANITIS